MRFGGPGAPSFVLKRFSLGLSAMVKKEMNSVDSVSPVVDVQTDTFNPRKVDNDVASS